MKSINLFFSFTCSFCFEVGNDKKREIAKKVQRLEASIVHTGRGQRRGHGKKEKLKKKKKKDDDDIRKMMSYDGD